MGLRRAAVAVLLLTLAASLGGCVLFAPATVAGPGETASVLDLETGATPQAAGVSRITVRNRGAAEATVWLTAWSETGVPTVETTPVVVGYREQVVCDGEVCRVERVPVFAEQTRRTEVPAVFRLSRYRLSLPPGGTEQALLTVTTPGEGTEAVTVTLGVRVRSGTRIEGAWLVTVVPVLLAGRTPPP